MNRTGFREMLRDRCPSTVDLALKWCKAKTAWVNLVYEQLISIYPAKKDRYEATKIALGLKKTLRNQNGFNFHYCIDWDRLTPEELDVWKDIEAWVLWFTKNYLYVENGYIVYRNNGNTEENIKETLKKQHMSEFSDDTAEKLITYLIKEFKEKHYGGR